MKQKVTQSIRIVPSEDEKLSAFDLLYNRVIRAFTLYLWKTRILPMLAEHPTFADNHFEVMSVQNACVESALMSVRDLDDFFRPKTTNDRASDLRAADFNGYISSGPFLSVAERDSINQRVAHLTYQPVWTNTTGIAPDTSHPWNTAELVGKAARAVIGFMNYFERDLSQVNSHKAKGIPKVRTTVELMLKNMENLTALESQ